MDFRFWGPGNRIMETLKIFTQTLWPFPNLSRELRRPWFSKISGGRGRVGVGLLGGGVYKAERARSVLSPVWFGPSREPAGLIRS